ncbi:MAG: hypothetical protein KKE73_06525 [Proteobacteria bacterium]|nr:hypothetical protein [Pseudomonadota bacterium]
MGKHLNGFDTETYQFAVFIIGNGGRIDGQHPQGNVIICLCPAEKTPSHEYNQNDGHSQSPRKLVWIMLETQ